MGIDARMFVCHKGDLTETEVRRLARDLVACFGPKRLFVQAPDPASPWPKGRHALEIIDVYEQDGPDVTPEPGEQFIEVALDTRYYGEGYERGDLPTILAIAQWLKDRIPGSIVWYGGDSSGVLAEPLTDDLSASLWARFVETGHDAYSGYFGRGEDGEDVPTCDFCGGTPMYYSGGGQGMSVWRCPGCEQLAGRRTSPLPGRAFGLGPFVFAYPSMHDAGPFGGWDRLRAQLSAQEAQAERADNEARFDLKENRREHD